MGGSVKEENDEARWAREELEEKAAEEKRELQYAWEQQVKSVLSHTRIDPRTSDKHFQLFEQYEGDVTAEHLTI